MVSFFIVDDSLYSQKYLVNVINAIDSFIVIAQSGNTQGVLDHITAEQPDVVLLSIETNTTDSLELLSRLMKKFPLPVLILSPLTEIGVSMTLQALELGALDFVIKPDANDHYGWIGMENFLSVKLKSIVKLKVRYQVNGVQYDDLLINKQEPNAVCPEYNKITKYREQDLAKCVIAIRASTGGVEALKYILSSLPLFYPPIVIVQHIPEQFSSVFVERLNLASSLSIHKVKEQMVIYPGNVYVAPGNQHMRLELSGVGQYVCQLSNEERVTGHRPSIDLLFQSICTTCGSQAVGVLLTGMGKDGAKGLLSMKEAGASVLIQDEQSSVIWGMPGEAFTIGCQQNVASLNEIPKYLSQLVLEKLAR